MAIRFVDVGPHQGEREMTARAVVPRPDRGLRQGEATATELAVKLPLAKPEPKQRGRKRPLR